MERTLRAALWLGLVLVSTGCNIRYISPGDPEPAPAESEQAGAAPGAEDAPWYRRVFAVAWAPDTTTPDYVDGEKPDPAATTTPPQATAAPHVTTAAEIHARENPVAADDPLRSVEYDWVMPRGITLEKGLRDWSEKVGLQLQWDVPRIFIIEAPIKIHGSFEYAFSRVMEAYALAERPVLFDYGLYANHVLRVTLKGELAP